MSTALISRATSKVREVINAPMRWYMQAMCAMTVAMMTASPTLCATIKSDLDMDKLFGSMVDIVLKIAFYCGALIAIGGVFSLIMAYKDDNADGQTRAIRLIVVGCVLVGLEQVLKMVGIIG